MPIHRPTVYTFPGEGAPMLLTSEAHLSLLTKAETARSAMANIRGADHYDQERIDRAQGYIYELLRELRNVPVLRVDEVA